VPDTKHQTHEYKALSKNYLLKNFRAMRHAGDSEMDLSREEALIDDVLADIWCTGDRCSPLVIPETPGFTVSD
jgi:hypothetical protein